MSFAINKLDQAPADDGEKVTVERHWCLTEDRRRVVPETDPDARWLHWTPGMQVPRAEAERLGALPTAPAEVKMQDKPADKAATRPRDKAARPDARSVREWALVEGFDVAEHGRIPAEVIDAYLVAHGEA